MYMLQTRGVLDYKNKLMGNPCGKYITDLEFLRHMIPHHQVAIDMSKKVLKYTTDPNIVYLARNIIFKQTDEIVFMENLLMSNIPNLSSKDKYMFIEIPNQFTVYYPKQSRAAKPTCTMHHFDPNLIHNYNNNNHNNHNKILTDKQYMKHMIPHHDVAITMAERVIKYSTNPSMIDFAYGVIKNQRYEIWLMRQYIDKSQRIFSPYFFT